MAEYGTAEAEVKKDVPKKDGEISKELWNKITDKSVEEIDAGLKWKQPRMDDIKKNEDLYSNKAEPALAGQWSIPLPIMGGFVDTLISELNQPVKINFNKTELGDLKKAKHATALWEHDSSPTRGAWNIKDLRGKKLAALSGRAIFNIYAESEPVYCSYFRNVHHYNFYIQQRAGSDIEEAEYLGELNLLKSKWDLESGPMAETYNKAKVEALILATPTKENSMLNKTTYDNVANSFRAMGLNPEDPQITGEKVFNFAQHYTTHEGVRYYVLIDPLRRIAIRIVKLKDIVKRGKWPYASWATHDDPANFWSKAPADDVRPIAISMKEAFDQSFNELFQRIRGKRAVDPHYFPNRAELEDFTTRFIEANVPAGKSLRDGYVEFVTPDNTALTINIMRFLDSFLGQKTGITPGAQGTAQEDKVGIYYGNIQQVARRMNLYSDFYKQCYAEAGALWLGGAQEHCKGEIAVRILGANGYESATITREDLQFDEDPDINITGGADEDVMNAKKNEQKAIAIKNAISVPALTAQYNPKWLAEQNLLVGGFDSEEIKRGLDLDTYGDQEVIASAYEAIALILQGENPPKNREATPAFMQTIVNYVQDYPELTDEEHARIMAYCNAHTDIVLRNAITRARQKMALQPQMGGPAAPSGAPSGAPAAPIAPQGPTVGGPAPLGGGLSTGGAQ